MQEKYGARGLAIVAVNVDKKRGDAERFLAQVPATFTVVYDAAGATPASSCDRLRAWTSPSAAWNGSASEVPRHSPMA